MEPGNYYHVYNRANAFEKLFYSDENYLFFMEKTNKYLPEIATLYAYSLLPNHFHFLIKTLPEESIHLGSSLDYSDRISQAFSNLFNSYTKSFNSYYRRRGTLFSRHFKSRVVETMNYRTNCVLYLHHNGVHHNLCREPDQWPYTSHEKVMNNPEISEVAEVISWFGGVDNYLNAYRHYTSPLEGEIYIE